ncbi:MAG: hypothetical protein ACR2OZ_10885 [Verrucomicrobiales bacterium]
MLFLSASEAATVIYDFSAPGFVAGEVTPRLAKPPASGSSTFRTDFTTSPSAGGFGLQNFEPNNLFLGQALLDIQDPPDVLRMTFNELVDRVQLDFAVVQSGRLQIITPVGNLEQESAPQGGQFEGGTLIFTSPTPFTDIQLLAFNDANARILFAIDDLRLNVVPEPNVCLLVLLAACQWLSDRRRTQQRQVCRAK